MSSDKKIVEHDAPNYRPNRYGKTDDSVGLTLIHPSFGIDFEKVDAEFQKQYSQPSC